MESRYVPHSGTIKSLRKAKDLLLLIAAEPGVALPQIAKKLAMPKTTAYRILQSLTASGFALQTERHRYGLGPLIGELAAGHSRREHLIQLARAPMTRLRDQCNETVALHVLQGTSWVAIDQVESTQQVRRTITNMGSPLPLHAGAPGKLLLAFLPEPERRAYMTTSGLQRFTAHTVTDGRKLAKELRDIARRGYSISFEELVAGVSSLAMPLRLPSGEVRAAVGVSGPATRFTARVMRATVEGLARTRDEIERALRRSQSH